jgi:hypothetical protein
VTARPGVLRELLAVAAWQTERDLRRAVDAAVGPDEREAAQCRLNAYLDARDEVGGPVRREEP